MAEIYLDISATGANNGTSQADAYTDMRTAFNQMNSSDDIMHVWPGNYTVSTGTSGLNAENCSIILEEAGDVDVDMSGMGSGLTVFTLRGLFNFYGPRNSKWIFRNSHGSGAEVFSLTNTGTTSTGGINLDGPMMVFSNNSTGILMNAGDTAATEIDQRACRLYGSRYFFTHNTSSALVMQNSGVMDVDISGSVFTNNNNGINDIAPIGNGKNNMTFNHCLLAGNRALTIRNKNVMTFNNSAIIGNDNASTIDDDDTLVFNDCILGERSNSTSADVQIITGNLPTFNNVTKNDSLLYPYLNNTGMRSGSVSLMIDDYQNLDAFKVLVTECESRGYVCSFSLDNTPNVTAVDWNYLMRAVNRGHDISIHTRDGANLSTMNAMGIQYTGDGSACTITIASGILTTSITGQTDGSENLNITLSDYSSMGALATFIEAETGYAAVTYQSDGATKTPSSAIAFGASTDERGYTSSPATSTLADVSSADIKTSVYVVQHDQTAFFDRQIQGCSDDIYNNTGYRPTTLVYPSAWQTDAFQTTIEQYIDVCRGGGTGYVPYVSSTNNGLSSMALPSYNIDDRLRAGSNANNVITANIIAMCEFAKFTGAHIQLYGHDLGGYSNANWVTALDAIQSTGVRVLSFAQQRSEIVQWDRTVTSDVVYRTNPWLTTDIEWIEQSVDINSDISAAGTKYWTTNRPIGIDGDAFPDSQMSIGPIQSKDAFHPKNI